MVVVDLVNVAGVVVVVVVSVMVSLLVGPRARRLVGDPPRVPRAGGWPSHPIYTPDEVLEPRAHRRELRRVPPVLLRREVDDRARAIKLPLGVTSIRPTRTSPRFTAAI